MNQNARAPEIIYFDAIFHAIITQHRPIFNDMASFVRTSLSSGAVALVLYLSLLNSLSYNNAVPSFVQARVAFEEYLLEAEVYITHIYLYIIFVNSRMNSSYI